MCTSCFLCGRADGGSRAGIPQAALEICLCPLLIGVVIWLHESPSSETPQLLCPSARCKSIGVDSGSFVRPCCLPNGSIVVVWFCFCLAMLFVFLQAAYDRGANYIYRVNDDSEMHTPWAESFVNALEVTKSSAQEEVS